MATNGDFLPATNGDFLVARDRRRPSLALSSPASRPFVLQLRLRALRLDPGSGPRVPKRAQKQHGHGQGLTGPVPSRMTQRGAMSGLITAIECVGASSSVHSSVRSGAEPLHPRGWHVLRSVRAGCSGYSDGRLADPARTGHSTGSYDLSEVAAEAVAESTR